MRKLFAHVNNVSDSEQEKKRKKWIGDEDRDEMIWKNGLE